MGADELREVVREVMLQLGDDAYERVESAIIRRAAVDFTLGDRSEFETRLGGGGCSRRGIPLPDGGPDLADPELGLADGDDAPRLALPEIEDIVRAAGGTAISDGRARTVALAAMRKAAERRIAGVTAGKRRGHYGHAAALVAACVACDGSIETGAWAAALRQQYRRFPALCAELDRRMGSG